MPYPNGNYVGKWPVLIGAAVVLVVAGLIAWGLWSAFA
jgi:hypothetical protein